MGLPADATPPAADREPSASLDQHGFGVRLEWGRAGARLLVPGAAVVVVVDVLSFSTAVSIAVEHGAAVYPHRVRDATAGERARDVGALLANPRRDGPGPSLSPASLTALRAGDRLVLPSPNGAACSLLAAEAGATVVAGCLRNASAVARYARSLGGPIAVVAAGELWPDGGLRPGIEDLLGAGAVVAALEADGADLRPSPEARLAAGAFAALRPGLAGTLAECASGRELIDRGFARDVELASEVDATSAVPVLVDEAFVRV